MSIIGTNFRRVWFLDTAGAICIAILILASSVSTAYEHMWFLVDKTAPQEFLNKLVYMSITHDTRARAYHAGDKYYIEVDIIMDENEQLQVTHDVSQTLQRKLEVSSTNIDPCTSTRRRKAPLLVRVKEKVFRAKSREAAPETSAV
ncbi:uncharacterized protein L3040_002096 [Drepanopeziza brunnea f. sp. 'multigermtubi']|uniref:uncharacterized protein n=1 Tax=Drepanopeziza brunnea f. sp. 'multigermtubi' TaxID=698441 RepID=UPI002395EFC7|nr:hypothetical protein L3040_002096 [Drepanopeziza brunnea f. sp. 'multigermtubi']